MKKRNIFLAIFGVATSLVSFQNCAQPFEIVSLNQTDLASLEGQNVQVKQYNPFICESNSEIPSRPLSRLTKIQIQNTLSDLLTPDLYSKISNETNLLSDDLFKKSITEYSNQITDDQMQAYQKIAEAAYNLILSDKQKVTLLAGTCINTVPVTLICKEQFIQAAGLKAFRRPLKKEEIDRFIEKSFALGESPAESVALIYYTLIMSPQFLLRLEVGNPDNQTSQTFSLTPYEVASRISYEVTDGPPDSLLYQAAGSDQLKTVEQIEPHIDRLIKSSRGKQKAIAFFKYLIEPKRYSKDSYNLDFSENMDINALNNEYDRELTEYLEEMIFNQLASFEEIMTSKKSFARTADVARIYGHEPVTDAKKPAEMSGERMGLLMRGPVLAGEGNESHPILRGVKLRARILCEKMGLPSGVTVNNSLFFSDDARLKYSTRYRTEGLTAAATCMGCHKNINPMGFAFENFDTLGRVRTSEKAYSLKGDFLAVHEINTESQGVELGSASPESIMDGPDLIHKLLERNQIGSCFVKQMHRFYSYLSETESNNCDFRKSYDQLAIANSNNSILTVLKNRFFTRDLFSRRIQN